MLIFVLCNSITFKKGVSYGYYYGNINATLDLDIYT